MGLGFIGVVIFSLTLPFTRMAVGGLDPAFIALGRAVVAALLAAAWLLWRRAPWPPRTALPALAMVTLGCVIGFPWLTSLALRTLPASHGAVMIGILPLATALASTLRGGERPTPGFWLTALAGSALVAGFALQKSGGSFHLADLWMLGAVVLAALGYAEGGRLSKSLGGEQVISWSLLLAMPLVLPLLLVFWPGSAQLAAAPARAWLGFAYVSAFSMFIGFIFWYRGMARGGVARVGQVQLLQPFLTLLGAWLLLGEALDASLALFAGAVILVVGLGRRMQVKPAATVTSPPPGSDHLA